MGREPGALSICQVNLPLLNGSSIVDQPVDLYTLAPRYAASAAQFIADSAASGDPFALYLAFSHVHASSTPT